MNTAELIVELLEEAGVEYIFGIPGGAIEDLNTALYQSDKIMPVVTKHEEGAAFMADGYARVSGRLGVCCATAGPGSSNLITGLASSQADSIPVCALTGQVATSVFGKGALQESGSEGINIVNVFSNFTKYSGMLINEKRAQYMIQKSLRLALSGRSGPVHLSLPSDLMKKTVTRDRKTSQQVSACFLDRDVVNAAVEILVRAKRPVIVAGWGVVLSRGADELQKLAEQLNIPVATSPKAKGVFPESHPLSLGVLGFAGSQVAEDYIIKQDVDVLLAVGTSFNEMMTGGWNKRLQPSHHLIQIDIDAEEIGKNYPVTLGLGGDANIVMQEIGCTVTRTGAKSYTRSLSPFQEIKDLKAKHIVSYVSKPDTLNRYSPGNLVRDLQQSCPADTIFFADMGNTMAWCIRHMVIDKPYSFFMAMGFGSMGYAVAAPVGAKLAAPDRPVVTMVGDGSFLMNGFEIATAVNYKIPVVWVVFNNAMLGMVYHGRRLFEQPIPEGLPSSFERVDFVKIAEGLGAQSIRLDGSVSINRDFMEDIFATGRPTVLDVLIDENAVPPIHSRIRTVEKLF
ncbi:MAG: thiamine pyrophosphate-binding protein [Gammaproteobacteria bacterium]|nr:thiamine pyrophosphate-binding protein [Gammaproteobacteria bacterium]